MDGIWVCIIPKLQCCATHIVMLFVGSLVETGPMQSISKTIPVTEMDCFRMIAITLPFCFAAPETTSATAVTSTPSTKISPLQESFEPLQSKDNELTLQPTSAASICKGSNHLLACTTVAMIFILCHDSFMHF